MKGLLLAMALLGGAFYFIHQNNPANGKTGQVYASATGEAIEATTSNYDFMVTHNEAPVLAYFWAPW